MPKKFKVFFDSSALISGLNSPNGAACAILAAFFSKKISIYISEQIIEEVQRNIEAKFPLLKDKFLSFLLEKPIITKEPAIEKIRKAYQLIQSNDAPILAAAIESNPGFLITWDIKHFLKKQVTDNISFIICTPKDFLQKYWKNYKQ